MSGDVNRTDCAFVDAWLDDWAAGRVANEVARRVDAHVAACERCRRLAAIVRGAEAEASGDEPDLLSEVLRQTTGSPCARAETLLPGFVDDELDADDRDILTDHLGRCPACSRLLAALQESAVVLPALAEVEPPPGFAEEVLRATGAAAALGRYVGVPGAAAALGRYVGVPGAAAAPGWQWWLRILARPRASLELAYVGTILLVVLLGNPVSAFHEAEQHASRLASAVPVARLTEELAVRDAAVGTIGRLLSPFMAAASAVATELSERWRQARALIDQIGTSVANLLNWLTTIDVKRIIGVGAQLGQPRGQPDSAGHPGSAQPSPSGRK
jgi:anti-sigma factor RsiW